MRGHKGKFSPKNPQKYLGNPTAIIYRSRWERQVMKYLDENPNVLKWQSDRISQGVDDKPNGFSIPYVSPVDGKTHRYYPDFVAIVRKPDNSESTVIIEVKPKNQTSEPQKKSRKTRRYITEVATWGVNQQKWLATQKYCANRGWEFKIITEDMLGIR